MNGRLSVRDRQTNNSFPSVLTSPHQAPGPPPLYFISHNPERRTEMNSFLQNFAAKEKNKKACCQSLWAAQSRGWEQRGEEGESRSLILCQGLDSPPAISLYQWTDRLGGLGWGGLDVSCVCVQRGCVHERFNQTNFFTQTDLSDPEHPSHNLFDLDFLLGLKTTKTTKVKSSPFCSAYGRALILQTMVPTGRL